MDIKTSNCCESDVEFYNSKQVAEIIGCSVVKARQIMRRKDFPLLLVGKNYKVSRDAFIKWANENKKRYI